MCIVPASAPGGLAPGAAWPVPCGRAGPAPAPIPAGRPLSTPLILLEATTILRLPAPTASAEGARTLAEYVRQERDDRSCRRVADQASVATTRPTVPSAYPPPRP